MHSHLLYPLASDRSLNILLLLFFMFFANGQLLTCNTFEFFDVMYIILLFLSVFFFRYFFDTGFNFINGSSILNLSLSWSYFSETLFLISCSIYSGFTRFNSCFLNNILQFWQKY